MLSRLVTAFHPRNKHLLISWLQSPSTVILAAAAAKSFQSCPTLWDPRDGSLPGSSIHGIFQARVLEWGAIAFSESDFGAPQNKVSHCFHCFPIYLP